MCRERGTEPVCTLGAAVVLPPTNARSLSLSHHIKPSLSAIALSHRGTSAIHRCVDSERCAACRKYNLFWIPKLRLNNTISKNNIGTDYLCNLISDFSSLVHRPVTKWFRNSDSKFFLWCVSPWVRRLHHRRRSFF